MTSQNGMSYPQNYDVIVKWLADAMTGETLEVFGIQSGRIEEVCGLEPVELPVRADRVDVLLRDDRGAWFHLEEQRDLRKDDLYRFALYHFAAARQRGTNITSIILVSGDIMSGEKVIETKSGTFRPLVIDFTQRDGPKRLAEIREAVAAGTFGNWFELVLLPLYGRERGDARSRFVEEVLRFETELYKARRVSVRLVAATFVLSNKFLERDLLEALWEDIKMLQIIEFAREKGIEEGKTLGIKEGKTLGIKEGKTLGIKEGKTLGIKEGKTLGEVEMAQELLLDVVLDKFPLIPASVAEQLRGIRNVDVLRALHRQAIRCQAIQTFETLVKQASPPPQEDSSNIGSTSEHVPDETQPTQGTTSPEDTSNQFD